MNRLNHSVSGQLFRLREIIGAIGIAVFVLALHEHAVADDSVVERSPRAMLRVGDQPALKNDGVRDPIAYEQFRKTQATLIKSRLVLKGVMREEGIADLPLLKNQDLPLQWLEDHVTVVSPPGTEVLTIKLDDPSPDSFKIVNAVVESYMKSVVNVEKQDALMARDMLEAKLRASQNDLQQKRNQLTKLSKESAHTTGDRALARERYSNLYRLLTDIRQRRLDIDLQMAAAKTHLSHAETNTPDASKAKLDIDVAESQIDVLQKTRDELTAELDRAAAEAADNATNSNQLAEVATLTSDIKDAEGLITQLKARLDQTDIELQLPARITVLEKAN